MHELFNDDTAKKRAYFQLMPMHWCIEFAKSAHQLDDNAYTYAHLTQFFMLQDGIETLQHGCKHQHDLPSTSGGCGCGHG